MEKGTLYYPEHRFNPEDLLTFIELKPFTRRWERLELTTDDLLTLQIAIMCDPLKPPVIPGTGGLRKLRFAPVGWNTGKSGALRVCYAYFEEHKTVLLTILYAKNEKENLTQEEKNQINKLLSAIKAEFDRG